MVAYATEPKSEKRLAGDREELVQLVLAIKPVGNPLDFGGKLRAVVEPKEYGATGAYLGEGA